MKHGWFTKFLVSKISGWIAVLALGTLVATSISISSFLVHYGNLKEDAAFCAGQKATVTNSKSAIGRVQRQNERDKDETIEDIQSHEDPKGCLDERAPDSVVEFHKRMRNE
jgi:hypothetical protein